MSIISRHVRHVRPRVEGLGRHRTVVERPAGAPPERPPAIDPDAPLEDLRAALQSRGVAFKVQWSRAKLLEALGEE